MCIYVCSNVKSCREDINLRVGEQRLLLKAAYATSRSIFCTMCTLLASLQRTLIIVRQNVGATRRGTISRWFNRGLVVTIINASAYNSLSRALFPTIHRASLKIIFPMRSYVMRKEGELVLRWQGKPKRMNIKETTYQLCCLHDYYREVCISDDIW